MWIKSFNDIIYAQFIGQSCYKLYAKFDVLLEAISTVLFK